LLAVFVVTGFAAGAMAEDVIKVGYLAALTGDWAPYGQTELNAAKLAVAEINAKGGVLGKQIQLFPYDFRTRPEDAVNAFRRMA
jgi:branched-chain amino acid transport system substrate-binding protein